MAAWADIRLFRIKLNDPSDCIDIKSVATLPAVPAYRTAYYLTTDSQYYFHDGSKYLNAPIRVIDELISAWLDAETEAHALVKGWKYLVTKIGEEMLIESDQTGADSVKFTSLQSKLTYYKAMIAQAEKEAAAEDEISTGTMYATKDPEIAGGLN